MDAAAAVLEHEAGGSNRSHKRWRRQVWAIILVFVPLLSGVFAQLSRALGLDSIGDVYVGDTAPLAFFSLFWGCPIATLAPTVLSRFSRRPWSQTRVALVAGLLASLAVGIGQTSIYAVIRSARLLLTDPVLPIWMLACGGAVAAATLIAGRAPAHEREAPVDVDRLIIRGIAFAVVAAVGFVFLILVSV